MNNSLKKIYDYLKHVNRIIIMEDDLEMHRKVMGKMEKNFLSLVDLLLTSVYSEFFHTCHRFSYTVALIDFARWW